MRKFELTITPNYVPSWGIVEAIRELFQNALDQQKQNPTNEASWSYDPEAQRLSICNKYSVLEASSLLLGQTTKADDESTIGQFGEGYKIATLVLLREGKKITFYNYGKREVWEPRFVNSRRFGTQILTFFVDTKKIWEKTPDSNLTIVIDGITEQEYTQDIVPSNLHLRTDYKVIESNQYGEVLDFPGNVYVDGLHVCEFAPYQYSYNFKPGRLKLDRDRKMASDFDLRWQASKIWSMSKNIDQMLKLLQAGTADVAYIKDVSAWTVTMRPIADKAYDAFRATYGSLAIPVSSQEELDAVPQGYKGVLVPETYKAVIQQSPRWTDVIPDEDNIVRGLFTKLEELVESLRDAVLPDLDTIRAEGSAQVLLEATSFADTIGNITKVIDDLKDKVL